jgi:hypothetical protein
MNSKDQIKADLKAIANNRGLIGESVDLQIDFLTYKIYNEKLDKINLAYEGSLDRAANIDLSWPEEF